MPSINDSVVAMLRSQGFRGTYNDALRKFALEANVNGITPSLNLPNKLINTHPTLVVNPYDGNEVAQYDAIDSNIAIDILSQDPTTSLPYGKVSIPTSDTAWRGFEYLDATDFTMADNDVWMVSVYLPERVTEVEIQLQVTDEATIGSNYRTFTWTNQVLQRGYNLFTCLNVERRTTATEYGNVETNVRGNWTDVGTATSTDSVRSIKVRCRTNVGQGTVTEVNLGSVHTAPAGWAKGAVMWGADDVQSSFIDLAGPIIESYGWDYTVFISSSYTTHSVSGHADLESVKRVRNAGHEIWGHARRHENLVTATAAERDKAIKVANAFFRAHGLETASLFMAYPGGNVDDNVVQVMKDDGMKLGATIRGEEINPFMAGINPYYINRFSIEHPNSWWTDSHLNGCILRGTAAIAYAHGVVEGGAGIDVRPAANRVYTDHLRRWCDLVASHESAGRCVVTTPLKYYQMCGIDPYTAVFAE